jgi:hypothetical protein
LIESKLTNCHQLFRKVCLFSPLPIRDLYANSCPQITFMFTAFRALALSQHHLFPCSSKLSERSAFPLALRGTRIVFLLLKQFSSELDSETEAEVILTLLIKLISGESDAGGLRPGYMRCLRWGSRAGKTPLYTSSLAHRLTVLVTMRSSLRTCRLCSDAEFMPSV